MDLSVRPISAGRITSAQIRAGRGLLRWTRAVLASRAAVSAVTLNTIESDQMAPRARTLDAIRSVREREGARFIGDERDGFGVLPRPGGAAGPNPPPDDPRGISASR